MLSVVYAECRKETLMLSVIMLLTVVMLSVIALQKNTPAFYSQKRFKIETKEVVSFRHWVRKKFLWEIFIFFLFLKLTH